VALSLVMGAITTGLTLLLVVTLDLGVKGVFLAGLVAPAIALMIGLRTILRTVTGTFSRRELHTMLAFGLPFVPVSLATWVIQLSDRFFVLKFASAGDLGLYSLGVRYSNLLLLPVTAFGIAWAPFFLALYNKDRVEELRVRGRTLSLVTLGLTWAAVAIAASSYTFFSVVTGRAFVDAHQVVGVLVPGIVAVGMNTVLMSGISIARRTHYFIRYTFYAAGMNLLLNLVLIPRWGILGAALSTSLTYVALAAMYGWRAQRLDPAPFDWSRVGRTLALGCVWLAPASLLTFNNLLVEFLLKTLLIVAFPFAAICVGAIHPDVLQGIRAGLPGRLRRRPAAL
jgi:O-antigen/teichoic acid export membrane protein